MDVGTEQASEATTTFHLGTGVGLVGATTLAVFEPMNAELASVMWGRIEQGCGIDELLDALSTAGLRTLGSFAMAQYEESAVRLVVRGSGVAEVVTAASTHRIVGEDVRTWHEELIAAPVSVTVMLGAPTSVPSPFVVTSGVLPAVGLVRSPRPATPLRVGMLVGMALPDPGSAVIAASDGPVDAPDPSSTLSVSEFLRSTGELSARARPSDSDVAAPAEASAVDPVAPAIAESDEPGSVDLDDDPGDEYDSIWGHTVARAVESAAVRPAEVDDAHHAEMPPTPPPVPSTDPSPAPQPPAVPVAPFPSVDGSGLIAAVPLSQPPSVPTSAAPSVPTSAAPSVPPAVAPEASDHDGRTMTRAQIQALKAKVGASPPSSPAMGGPAVQAVVCAAGHASPPHFQRCRVCGVSVDGPPVMVARPVLGSLSFSDGTQVALDRPAVIGRNPKLEGAMPSEIPAIVKLDVGQGLSRSHALVRIEGWQVLLEDLNSANGTIVQAPGRPAQRMRNGEPVLLENGTTIDFGGEISCVVEVL